MSNIKISIPALTDENGMVGRECPECEEYFKVRFGTGLETTTCVCPYCQHENQQDHFYTKEQVKYIESYARKYAFENLIKPELAKLDRSFKNLERATRNSFFQITVKSNLQNIRYNIDYYHEKDLETNLICDSCGLEFSIYGVFATCPDCRQMSAITVFKKSLEVLRKKLLLVNNIADEELTNSFLQDALSNSISIFDSFGKALIKKHQEILSSTSKNLFQNISLLSDILRDKKGKSLAELVGDETFYFLVKMFQVRHIFEHNFGEIDESFIKKVPEYQNMLKRKYLLDKEEINRLIMEIEQVGNTITEYLLEQPCS